MSLLHGNFRKKAIDIDYNAVGGGIANWIQGSNLNPDFRFGGFVMASFASQLSGVGFLADRRPRQLAAGSGGSAL